jgi:signal transduction histidine kinase
VGWVRQLRLRSRGHVLAAALVLTGLTVFVLVVYLVLVVGGGALTGHPSEPPFVLSVLATALVALAFDPVQTRLERAASRVVNGGQPAPYDVLRTFSRTVTGSYAAEELPERMARVLANGTGAEWAQVWLVVDDEPRLAATWPPSATPDPWLLDVATASTADDAASARRTAPVRDAGELLGLLVVHEHRHHPLSSVEVRLFTRLAQQAGPVLRGARLTVQLGQRLAELSARADELRSSRLRLVEAQDAGRRRLERDIHDGAQQHLVALAVNLRLAETLTHRSAARAESLLAAQEAAAVEAIEVLVALSSGIYPAALAERGLVEALRTAAVTGTIPVVVTASDVGRYAAEVEATAYFCCLEALQNAAKHSGASAIRISLEGSKGWLRFVVEDDGVGFDHDATPPGAGLTNLRDRVQSANGTLETQTAPGCGTRIRAAIPAQQVREVVLPDGQGS